ncbi:Bug family tripartite tricarboxylate transporter substrate binding protein [Neoroseomonas soli]|uniref:Tripartite tricarboxylate transporter substrate binding protein n=1 Tax=Neoroseomonas soli TaxID=1081025 RepID=A0A9X9X3F1_9PROT|nr:tripartite tricarboxylate transporter substrate-binding protein [Neoroseomonas soli]MBR0673930.1 tripartite tricarboxylate transporter substrate binding protein [Neoroseomonas soli]
MPILRRALLGALALPALARAQGGWAPDRPARLVVPFAPGGSQDVLGRLFAQAIQAVTGQQMVVENRAGAGGILGGEAVARGPADGLSLLLATAGQTTIPKAIGRRMPYDPQADLAPVMQLLDSPVALLAAPNLPAADAAALIALARSAPTPLSYASTGIGTNTHLIMEDLKARERLNVEHVPYRGAAAAFNDLLAGRIALMFVSVPSVLGFSGGALKVLATTGDRRFPTLPDVPTLTEGAVPGFTASIWTGLALRAGTPPAAIAYWQQAFVRALAEPSLRERLDGLGVTAATGDAAAFAALMRDDLARWIRVAAPLNISLD